MDEHLREQSVHYDTRTNCLINNCGIGVALTSRFTSIRSSNHLLLNHLHGLVYLIDLVSDLTNEVKDFLIGETTRIIDHVPCH